MRRYQSGRTFPADVVGMMFGERRVLAETAPRGPHRRVRWICTCGRVGKSPLNSVSKSVVCRTCAQKRGRLRNAEAGAQHPSKKRDDVHALLAEAIQRAPDVWLSDERASVEAWGELAAMLGPCTLSEIAVMLRICRERVRQIEQAALRKLHKRCTLAGLSADDIRERACAQSLLELHAWGGDEEAA